MINYYNLLEIPQSASREEIVQAIKKTRRLWNNRANSPNSAIRAEAEQHVREVAEAEKILLDPAKREEYNRQLAQNPNSQGPVETFEDKGPDWEDEFFEFYNKDLNDYAAQLAEREIRKNERNGRAWYLYGEAIRRGGDPERSIEPLKRATVYISDDANIYRQLGFAYMDADRPADALRAFYEASRLNPSDTEYLRRRSEIFTDMGMIDEALREAKKAFDLTPNENDIRYQYFRTLYEDAIRSISYNRSSGKHLITNKVQLDYVNGLLKEMALTLPKDSTQGKCKSVMDEIVQYVVDAESKKGGLFGKIGYEYNYKISNSDTRASGRH